MFFREYQEQITLDKVIMDKYELKKVAYFDIEATGFDKKNDIIMLISLGYFTGDGEFVIKQYFAEDRDDEENILRAFKRDIDGFDFWCSYNGKAFDEPFIVNKMKKNGIDFEVPANHIDLFRLIKPYHIQLGMERCNLKTVEKFIGIEREDQIDGGVSVQLYKQYTYTGNEGIRDTIMLHNYEDVLYLPELFKVIYRIDTDKTLKRPPKITEDQIEQLTKMIEKLNITLESDIENISKKAAQRAIRAINRGEKSAKEIDFIIKDTF